MTTAVEVQRSLMTITTSITGEMLAELEGTSLARAGETVRDALRLFVPDGYDAAGALAVDWYEESREAAEVSSRYEARIIGDPAPDWIERETDRLLREVTGDLDAELAHIFDAAALLAEKEMARGFRDSILGNAALDEAAVGWSRIARPGACRMCTMLAGKGAVYRSEDTATFATHASCHCAARPHFRGGHVGVEASAMQYMASRKRRSPAERKALRKYLNDNYPDGRG